MALALSDSEIYQIAVGCFYILMRRAQINFPGSFRSRPSEEVVVNWGGPEVLRSGDTAFFPFSVRWDVWQFGVVPMLKDPANQVFHSDGTRNQNNLNLVGRGDYNTYIDYLAGTLRRRLQELGFIPPDPESMVTEDSDLEGDGDPIVRVGSIGDSGFPIVDDEAGDLNYPIVED